MYIELILILQFAEARVGVHRGSMQTRGRTDVQRRHIPPGTGPPPAAEEELMVTGLWRGPRWRLFDADPGCGKSVRDWISCVVACHPCPADPADAAVVASELFTNAVTHGPPSGQVLAGYVLWPQGARIIVCDGGGTTMPKQRDSSGLDEGGRGLQVVDGLSAQWGSFRTPQAQVVWCDLGQPMHAAAGDAWAWLSAVLADITLARAAHGRQMPPVLCSPGPHRRPRRDAPAYDPRPKRY
jgi:hypothetical protein